MANGSLLIVNSDHSIIPHEMIQMDLKWWIARKAFYEPVLILANIPKGLKGCSIRSMNLPRILEFTVTFSHTIVSSNVMFHSLPCLYLGRVRRLAPGSSPSIKNKHLLRHDQNLKGWHFKYNRRWCGQWHLLPLRRSCRPILSRISSGQMWHLPPILFI